MIETFIKKGQTLEQYAIRYVSASIKELPLPEKVKTLAILKRYRQLAKISSEMFASLKEIEKRYIKMEEPILNNVANLISGSSSIQDSQLQNLQKYLNEDELKQVKLHLEPRKITGYWKTCLKNLSIVKETIGKDDETLLEHLQNIYVVDEEVTDNFTIHFKFSENTVIKNAELTKKYYLENDIPVRCESSAIEWVDRNLTVKEIKKKQKNKKTGQSRVITKQVKNKSFFNFFINIDVSSYDPNPNVLTQDQLKNKDDIQSDFEMGGMIVDDMLPYSLEYYLGIKHEGDDQLQGDQDQDGEKDDQDQEGDNSKGNTKVSLKGKKSSKSKSKEKSRSKDKKDNNNTGKNKKDNNNKSQPEEKPECKQQ